MQFEHVPAELRTLRQWAVWRATPRQGKITKPPFRADDPNTPADVHYPHTWCSFDEAVACLYANPSIVSGIGFFLTEADPFLCFDLDDPTEKPTHVREGRQQFQDALLSLGTYSELSPSGRGLHVWMKGKPGVAGKFQADVASEMYAWQRFITVTGRPITTATEILDCQSFIRMIGLDVRPPEVVLTDDGSKPTDLPDDEVLRRAYNYSSYFGPRYMGHVGCLPGEWSHTFVSVVGILDRLTGNVDQLKRLVQVSPMVANCAPAGSGESRPAKASRTFADVLSRVRRDNLRNSFGVAHGREVWAAIVAEKERVAAERAKAEADRLAAQEAEAEAQRRYYDALGKAGRVVEGYSHIAEEVLARFTMFEWEHRKMTLPPGRAGAFVKSVMHSSYIPDDRFATPTTLAAISGIVARSYMTDDGNGLNLNFLMLGKPGTGKSSAMETWGGLLSDAIQNPPPQHGGKRSLLQFPLSDHIIRGKMQSGHGFHLSVQDKPSAVWFLDEAASQYSEMIDGKDKNGAAILGVYNQLYDKAKHGEVLSPPSSMSTRQSGMTAVAKPAISTLWACPPTSIEITTEALTSGLLSRLVIVNNPSNGQVPRRDVGGRPRALPDDLKCCLLDLLNVAASTNFYYKPNPAAPYPGLIYVSTAQVAEMAADFAGVAAGVMIGGNDRSLPNHYTAFTRVASSAMRLAAVLAVIENPYLPVVTGEQFKWAAGYVVQNLALLLSDMDSGEVGAKASDEWLGVKRVFVRLRRKGAYKDMGGVSRGVLLDAMKDLKVFYGSKVGPAKAASACLDLMVRENVLEEMTPNAGKPGRPARVMVPNSEHDLWKS